MDEPQELPALLPAITYLREIALEAQELHAELRLVGFTEKQATNIVGQMVSDALQSRNEDTYTIEYSSYEDDDDEDDTYDGGISGQ